MRRIHRLAVVDPSAELGEDVEIGPFVVIEAGASIGDRTRIMASAVIEGCCEVGPDCEVHAGAALGGAPQMRIMSGPGGRVTIGSGTIIREHVTVHRAVNADAVTTIGLNGFLLAHSHVAHDCRVGDEVTMANGALLAGHVTVGDRAFISGNSAVHQFVRIGRVAMIGGGSRVTKDVLPFTTVALDSEVFGLNVVGLRRAGFSSDERLIIKRAYRTIYRSGLNVSQACAALRAAGGSPLIDEMVAFAESAKRGLCAGGPRGQRMQKLSATDDDTQV
jgi:UDP-N-acetylglucosamine acyltransferase